MTFYSDELTILDGVSTDPVKVADSSDEENEDVAADKLIHRYLAEARLDEAVEAPEEKQSRKKKTGKKEPKSLNIEVILFLSLAVREVVVRSVGC